MEVSNLSYNEADDDIVDSIREYVKEYNAVKQIIKELKKRLKVKRAKDRKLYLMVPTAVSHFVIKGSTDFAELYYCE